MASASPKEIQQAIKALNAAQRSSCFGQLGGFRPSDINDRYTSWWGGNFLAAKGEAIPKCMKTGNTMSPVLQLRIDELPFIPDVFQNISLMGLWFDLSADPQDLWEGKDGVGFVIRTYDSNKDLVPIGSGYGEHPTFPTFPIKWHLFQEDLPSREEFVDKVPLAVAQNYDSSWFHCHEGLENRSTLQKDMPIKIGGYSQWWQSPQHVEGGKFAFFLDSTARGQFGFPGGGNANFFKTESSWEVRVDCL